MRGHSGLLTLHSRAELRRREGDASRQVGEGDSEAAVRVFEDDSDELAHGDTLRAALSATVKHWAGSESNRGLETGAKVEHLGANTKKFEPGTENHLQHFQRNHSALGDAFEREIELRAILMLRD